MLNSHANAHNDKNTINLQNANSQQKEQTQAIVKFKEMKKRKVMKSLQKEVNIEVSTSKCYNVIFKEMQIKRLRERIEFAINQLRQAISEQKETISHSLIYIWKVCNESIENSIQKQIDWIQSQINNKMLKTSKRESMRSKWQRICKLRRRSRFRKRCKSCKIRKNQRRSSHMCKKQLKSQVQMQMNEIWLSKNPRQSHKKYHIAKEDW